MVCLPCENRCEVRRKFRPKDRCRVRKKKPRYLIRVAFVFLTLAHVASCGAPTQSASSVDLSRAQLDLSARFSDLCAQAAQSIQLSDGCGQADTQAPIVTAESTSLPIRATENQNFQDSELQKLNLNTAFQLDFSVVSVVAQAQKVIRRFKKGGISTERSAPQPGSQGQGGGVIDVRFEVLSEPQINSENLTFSVSFRIQTTGIVKVDQTIQIDGTITERGVLLLLTSGSPQPFERSISREIQGLITVIPDQNRLYVSTAIEATLYRLGADSIGRDQFEEVMQTALIPFVREILKP